MFRRRSTDHSKAWAALAALLCAPLSAPLSACSATDMMSGDYESMQTTLTSAEAENQHHADACEAAPSMPEMMDELARHEKSMNDIMRRMDEARGYMGDGSMGMGMRHCTGSSFDHMSQSVDDIHSMMSDHLIRIASAESLDAACSECSTHTGSMDGLMQNMMTDLESMACVRR